MNHPFEKIEAVGLRKVYWLFLGLTAGVALWLGELAKYQDCGVTKSVPTVAFEFARTPEAWEILTKAAGPAGMAALRTQTYADYVFLLTYSTLIAAGIAGVMRGAKNSKGLTLGRSLAWGQWFAALMDAVENAGLLININGPVSATWTQVSSAAAAIKFAIILLGVLYIYIVMALSWRDEAA